MTAVLSAAEGRAFLGKPKANKYNAKRCTIDGINFDSRAEGAFYASLKLREKAGEVVGVELQPRFELLGPKGELICVYKADFAFFDNVADRFRVVDVKGVETKEFRLKHRMMKALKGIDVEVVK